MRTKPIIAGVFVLLALLCAGAQTHILSAACLPPPELTARQYLPYIVTTASEHAMGDFFIIQPQTTTNLITNPSFETATTGWAVNGGSIAQSSAQQKRGVYSGAYTPSSGTTAGAYFALALTNGLTYTFSVDVLGVLGIPYQIAIANTSNTVLSSTTFTGTGLWQRVELTYTETSSTTRRLYVMKNSSADVGVIYIDGAQMENLAFSTTYCDGDQKGCIWTGAKHSSTSQRAATARSGGKKIDLTTLNAYLVSQQGTGMPPIATQSNAYSAIDGSFFQRQTVQARPFTIAFSTSGNGVAAWHANRQALIDLIKPDLVYPPQPFVLGYTGGGKELRLECVYDGGLDMQAGDKEIETVAIKCLALDPMWKTDGTDGVALTVQQTLTANYFFARSTSWAWSSLGSANPNNGISEILYDAGGGFLYALGGQTLMGGTSTPGGLAYWNGSNWVGPGLAASSNRTSTIGLSSIGPDGKIYIAASKGVVNQEYVQRYSTRSGAPSWADVGGYFNGSINRVLVAPDGTTIYAVGIFTTSNGATATSTNHIAKWNGSAWVAIGTGTTGGTLAPGQIWDCLIGYDGYLYIVGEFTAVNGVSASAVARYNPSTGVWSALGSGLTGGSPYNRGFRLAFGLDGALYVVGQFTTAGGVAASGVAKWNGTSWSALGAGLTTSGLSSGIAVSISVNPIDGTIIVGGASSSPSGVTFADNLALWNGSSWNAVDLDTSAGNTPIAFFKPDGSLYIGNDASSTNTAPGQTTVTNGGTAKAYPKITIKGPTSGSARVWQIASPTIGKTIYLNYTINAGETAIMDLTPGSISFTSDFQGNLMNKVMPGSSLTDFALMPGANTINLFIGDSSATAIMQWTERCWSVDSSGT